MRRSKPLPAAAAGALTLVLAAAAWAAPATTPDDESHAAEAPQGQAAPAEQPEQGAAAEPAAPADLYRVEGGQVEVRDALPFIPTANTIASKLPLPLRLTPASVSVVPAPLLAEQGATVLGDALENVSGVNPQNGNGVFDFWIVRGFDSVSSGLILTDGAPEPESTFYQLYNVERAEVLKGPSAFLYGGSPLAGTVNLVRKQPLAGRFVRAGAAVGSFATREGTVDANWADADGRRAFRVNGLWRESDGFRDGRESRDRAVNPSFSWRPDDDTTVNVNFEHVATDHRADAGLPLIFTGAGFAVADVPRRRSYQSPFDLSEQEIDRFQIDFEHRVSDKVTVRDKAYYRRLDWLSRAAIFGGVFPGAGGRQQVARSLLLLDDRQEFYGNQLEALVEVDGWGARHHLLAGLEVARLADRFTFDVALLPTIDLLDPVETTPASLDALPRLPGQSLGADATSVVVAPYLVDQITLSDRFQLLLGVRYDTVDFDDARSGTGRDDSRLSPLIGVLYAPRADLSLYANAGGAFAPPSTFVREQDRRPEESEQVELGVKKSFLAGRVEATAAAYQLERLDIAIPDANGVTRQTGDQRSRGFEVEVRALPAPRLRVFFAYAWNDAELTDFAELVLVDPFRGRFAVVDRSGNAPAFAPDHIANLWVSRGLPRGFTVAGGARWVSDQFIDEDNAFAIDGYFTLDAAVTWNRGRWRASLNLDNLTGEEYLTRGFGSTSVIPAPGFAATAGLEVSF